MTKAEVAKLRCAIETLESIGKLSITLEQHYKLLKTMQHLRELEIQYGTDNRT